MADNVAITAGSGTNVAADELTDGVLGSVKVQFAKLMDGTLDSSNKLVIDSSGRLQAAVAGTALVGTSATLSTTASPPTSPGSNTAGVVIDASLAGNVTVVLAGTYTGSPVVVFEISVDGGTTWVPWQGVPAHTRGAMQTTTTLAAGVPQAWELALPGALRFRVRLTTAPASNTVSVVIEAGSWLYDPIPSAEPHQSGRTACTFRNTFTTAAAAETVQNLVATRNAVAAAAAGTQAVTAGKTLRFTTMTVSVRTTTAALPWVEARIRMNPTGAAVIGSPEVLFLHAAGNTSAIGNANSAVMEFPDGYEISGTTQFILTIANNVATNVINVALHGFEY